MKNGRPEPSHFTPQDWHARFQAQARWSLAEKTVEYPRWDIYGRHIIDTYFLVQLYDVGGRNLRQGLGQHLQVDAFVRPPRL